MRVAVRRPNQNEHLQEIVREYEREFPEWDGNLSDVASWALQTRRFSPPPLGTVSRVQKLISSALRIETFRDPQGRTVRKNHAVRVTVESPEGKKVQRFLWKSWETASQEHMQASFQGRRMRIYDDCRKLKTDADSWNENKGAGGEPIQLLFDFTYDLAESELSDIYEGISKD
ncbi:MAG: hypothetical protein LN413_00245 [Candidatus Thermoplasmatota archaeon]|nr:hypothetical protein [Candidatus Thermoplasmatota archaeon]